jgi:dipeptidyl aminopeptidase/acylaminoacyl peptidase
VGAPQWSPDNRQIAFTNSTGSGIELWVAVVATGESKRVTSARLNGVAGSCSWLADSRRLLCAWVPDGRGAAPAERPVPAGPTIQETSGSKATIVTYQDMLHNAHDEALFDYYFTSQLGIVDVTTGERALVGAPAVLRGVGASPSGEYLLVTRIQKPYSYLFPASSFPQVQEERAGRVVRQVVSRGLQENMAPNWVVTGPRSAGWRPQRPATLVWTEALDGGDPKKEVPHRDRVLMLAAPFTGEPVEIGRTEERYAGIQWGQSVAFISDYKRPTRRQRTWEFEPDRPATAWRLVWDLNTEDAYGDPGSPLMQPAPGGSYLLQRGDWLYLSGTGASAEGDRPFLDRFNLKTLKIERLWRSEVAAYESVVALLSDDARRVITRRESATEPPNYFVLELPRGRRTPLTSCDRRRSSRDQQAAGLRPQTVCAQRHALPAAGYQAGTTAAGCGPARASRGRQRGRAGRCQPLTSVSGASHLFFLTQGYAVFDGPSMPILGGDTANNTYIQQLVASAQAAVDKVVEMGVADRDRIGVGGHSYGAFMTANLLAHTDLFRAGIARSGAYNRSLTPFGFQAEERTFWEVPELYERMSPFWYAHQLKEPILFTHGEADNNTGTFPIQSERMYAAVKGNGGIARLVFLPNESHGYAAAESNKHVLYEMISWFDKHVKNAPRRPVTHP